MWSTRRSCFSIFEAFFFKVGIAWKNSESKQMNCDHLLSFQNLDKITALRINDWTLQKGGVWLSFWQGCFGSPVITSDSGIPWFLGCMFFWAGSLNHESVDRNDTFDEVRLVCEPCKWALFLGTKSSLIIEMEETKSFVEKDFGHPNSGTLTWNPKTGGLGRCFFLFLSEANSGSTLNFGVISHLPSSALEIRSSPSAPREKLPSPKYESPIPFLCFVTYANRVMWPEHLGWTFETKKNRKQNHQENFPKP